MQTINKLQEMRLPTAIPLFGSAAAAYGWKLGASAGYVGQGMIMGNRVCLSMLAGSVAGFGILAPLAVRKGWASMSDTPTGSPSTAPSPSSSDEGSPQDTYAAFLAWVAMSIMIADSLTSLAVLVCRHVCQAAAKRRRARGYSSLGAPQDPRAANYEGSTVFVAAAGVLHFSVMCFLVPWTPWVLHASCCVLLEHVCSQ